MPQGLFKIAVIATTYTAGSHADVIVGRWLKPLPTDPLNEWNGPSSQIVSLYVLQHPAGELSRGVCEQYGILESSSSEEALTLGTSSLAVDAVMIIGEHGEFPENEFGQKLYPRREMLDEVLEVFDRHARVIPLFFDKHLSWHPAFAREMYWALQRRGVPWFGGSSLSFAPLDPSPGNLRGENFQEVVVTTWGALEAYLFHALEILAAVVEQRRGGETGVESVIAWRNSDAWEALDRGEFSRALLDAALASASLSFQAWDRFQSWQVFQIRYRDGLRASIVRLEGIRKWTFACRIAGRAEPVAAAVAAGSVAVGTPHFARLARRIEDFFLTGISPVSPSRLYFSTLACAYCMQALPQSGMALPDSAIIMPPAQDNDNDCSFFAPSGPLCHR